MYTEANNLKNTQTKNDLLLFLEMVFKTFKCKFLEF